MNENTKDNFLPYDQLEPGFEAIYVDEKLEDTPAATILEDDSDRYVRKWSLWNFKDNPDHWDEDIIHLNRLQTALGPLSAEARKIRAHIASLTPCDSGLPVTVDELLIAIGRGKLIEPSFHNGCWNSDVCETAKSSQPGQVASMQVVFEVFKGYLAGDYSERFIEKYPYAESFIQRTYQWLGPVANLTQLQKLLLERMLLPFVFLTKASVANPRSMWPKGAGALYQETMANCYEDDGHGAAIDAEIEKLAGLPKISMAYPEYAYNAGIDDPGKKNLYVLCCSLAHGLHTLCDCHHSTFRWIENWIYAIGTGEWGIPTRTIGTERKRVGRLLFGYLLGLDKWLLGIPMQFLLLELGHVNLGFDPKNEIVRVYAYLTQEKTPTKEWLVACLWHSLMYSTGGLSWQNKHHHLLENAAKAGISIREWMDSQLQSNR